MNLIGNTVVDKKEHKMLDLEKLYKNNLIETKVNLQTYLIEPPIRQELLNYIGESRVQSFSRYFDSNEIDNDIEERDKYYYHFILWNSSKKEIIGGQRMLFYKKNLYKSIQYSYLEHTYPSICNHILKIKKGFAEIGRTFLMPNYQNTGLFKELIRGFTRIPEALDINYALGLVSFDNKNINKNSVDIFINSLSNSKFRGDLILPKPKFKYEIKINQLNENYWDGNSLKKLEKNLQKIDTKFRLPDVLIPYRLLCSVNYEGISYAGDYNKILQLLFSGASERISKYQRSRMPNYSNSSLVKLCKIFN